MDAERDNKMNEWVNELRVAIILNAIEDYKKAVAKNKLKKARELKEWFLSEWAEDLSGDMGKSIIKRVLNGGIE